MRRAHLDGAVQMSARSAAVPASSGPYPACPGNHPISGNGNGWRLAFEEFLTQTVRRRRTGESLRDVHRIVRRSLIKLRKRGQTWSLVRPKQMIAVESSNRRDPCATGNSLRASCHNFLHFANRVGVLERGVITGPVPHQDNVIVIVDNAGHCWPSAKVYDADSRSLPRNGATHCGEAIHYAAGEPGFFFCRSNSFMKAASRSATYAL